MNYSGLQGVLRVCAVRMSLFTPASSLLVHGTVTDCHIGVWRVCLCLCVCACGVCESVKARCETGTAFPGGTRSREKKN